MKPATIGDLWRSFESKVMPKDAPPEQRLEMRRAFYAGCHGLLCEVQGLGAEEVSEDAGVLILENWKREIGRFYYCVKQGTA